jgi:hypothetical protein
VRRFSDFQAGLRSLLGEARRLRRCSVQSVVQPSLPVLYFGDSRQYYRSETRVLTVGLNPSRREFPVDDPFRRFPAARAGGSRPYPSVRAHADALDDYFRVDPYRAWFKAYDEVLLGLDCSYYEGRLNVALHTDLCSPLATDPTWTRLPARERAALLRSGIDLWHRLVTRLKPDVIVLSIARRYVDQIAFPTAGSWTTVHSIQRKNPYRVQGLNCRLSDRDTLLVFGRASQLPFGSVSRDDKAAIGASIARAAGNPRGRLCFVQFIHPGKEHPPDDGTLKGWNRGPHRRKFMEVPGRCVRSGPVVTAPLVFWGEWEAQSEVVREIAAPVRFGPRFIHRPFYQRPRSYRGLQNTDPFVFGERFLYTGCQQWTVRGPTQLRFLQRGSVILFGSCIGERHFAVDTVFVVADWVDHDRSNYRQRVTPRVPPEYADVTLWPWYASGESGCGKQRESFRLYFGATYKDRVCGMFSFFPCAPAGERLGGFTRPVIRLRGVVTSRLKQGKRLNPIVELREARSLWQNVAKQVRDQGLWLGVEATMPSRRHE